jgi:hypothetical protein
VHLPINPEHVARLIEKLVPDSTGAVAAALQPMLQAHAALTTIFEAVERGASFSLDGPNTGATTRAIAGTLATPDYLRYAQVTDTDLHKVIVGLALAWERDAPSADANEEEEEEAKPGVSGWAKPECKQCPTCNSERIVWSGYHHLTYNCMACGAVFQQARERA